MGGFCAQRKKHRPNEALKASLTLLILNGERRGVIEASPMRSVRLCVCGSI